jgi:hypothetical protein
MSLQNIRAKTVGAKKHFKEIEFDFDGEKVFFRQPTRGQFRDIQKLSVREDGFDFTAYQVWSVIRLTYDTKGERVFSDADFDGFMDEPTGGWLDEFSEKAMAAIAGNKDPKSQPES